MHMEALDRSFSSLSHHDGGGLDSASSYPLTPEPQIRGDFSDVSCLVGEPSYSPIDYHDHRYQQYDEEEVVSPVSSSEELLDDHPLSHYSNRTPLSSVSSYSSDASSSPSLLLSSSQSSGGLSDLPSLSNMSISSNTSSRMSSASSLYSDPSTISNNNSNSNTNNTLFNYCNNSNTYSNNNSANTNRGASKSGHRRKVNSKATLRNNIMMNGVTSGILDTCSSDGIDTVPRRRSAPARDGLKTSNSNSSSSSSSSSTSRKDSFVYDVQLESDNVLLFVPDLVSSHTKMRPPGSSSDF